MAVERTLSIIKPDAVGKNVIGQIISRFEEAGLTVVAAKMLHLSDNLAGGFYAEHRERPFYPDLVKFMTSGPVIVQVLEGESAIARNRELMGATNPQEADAGTIRADFAQSIDANAVHGSDSPASAEREIAYFFASSEICPEGAVIEAEQGESVCEALLRNDIEIEHACEMSCACTTCHVIVREGFDSLEEADELEEDYLDKAWGLEPESRLSCQAQVGETNLVVEIPRYTINHASERH